MDQYGLNQQEFAYVFGLNAFGIMLMSSLNKHLTTRVEITKRLKAGSMVQVTGASIVLIAGLISAAPLWLVMLGLFLAISGIGLTGPNAMALAMSKQGARAGTASAIMGSMQFACGLLGGVLLNFLIWSASLNMGSDDGVIYIKWFYCCFKSDSTSKSQSLFDFKRVIGLHL